MNNINRKKAASPSDMFDYLKTLTLARGLSKHSSDTDHLSVSSCSSQLSDVSSVSETITEVVEYITHTTIEIIHPVSLNVQGPIEKTFGLPCLNILK